jgi:hypothetical protein
MWDNATEFLLTTFCELLLNVQKLILIQNVTAHRLRNTGLYFQTASITEC